MVNKLQKSSFITDPNQNLAQWYTDVCKQADLFDYGPVKGTIIIKPYALKIWHLIKKYLTDQFDALGILEIYLPMLIPASLLNQEINQLHGFEPELMIVNQIGQQKLNEPLYLRPTSETLISNYFQKTIKSYRDLPVKYNQWCNVMRWEKNTRPFLRNSEFLWQEGHAAHADARDAQSWQHQIWELYKKTITKLLLIPILAGEKTAADTFAGAIKTLTVECALPQGYTLQCATSHYFGQKIAKIYQIQFQNQQQKQTIATTTSWGLSTRLIGALVLNHGDQQGLILPWNLAPIQIMIIPYNWTDKRLIKYGNIIKQKIISHYRVQIDQSDRSFGFRTKATIAKGVPIWIKIGFTNVNNQTVTIGRRDTNELITEPVIKMINKINKIITEYDHNLWTLSATRIHKNIIKIKTWPQFVTACQQQKIIKTTFCGQKKCELKIKTDTYREARCLLDGMNTKLVCFKCQKTPAAWTIFARSY